MAKTPKAPPPLKEPSDEELFGQAMRGTQPIESGVLPCAPVTPSVLEPPEKTKLPSKKLTFRYKEEASSIEASLIDLGPKILRKLKRGKFPIEAIVDLHGMDVQEAQSAVEQAIQAAVSQHQRCVLIVHGKGHHSHSNKPILKSKIREWLTESHLAELVLAYTSAQPSDGGNGAVYVLTRRKRED